MLQNNGDYSAITPEIEVLAKKMTDNSIIDPSLYSKYNVKRGLRDLDGKVSLRDLQIFQQLIRTNWLMENLFPATVSFFIVDTT